MPTTANRPPLMVAVAALLRRLGGADAEHLDLVVTELDRRGLEVRDLTRQLRVLRQALLSPDQPTAIKNLIELRAQEMQR